jgi:hypothetical protein
MKIYFITFGSTHNYLSSLNRIKIMATQSGFFDKIIIYTEKDFDNEFLNKYGNLMQNNTGYGFWIWKSYFVRKTFQIMDDGDIMVYADAGCSIIKNIESYKKFKIYINLVKAHPSGSLGFQMDIPEELYTKSAIFKELDADSDNYRKSGQLVGGIFFLRKCVKSIELITNFYDSCQKINLIDNTFDINNEIPTFKAPRNDQSIFSVLRKKHGSLLVPDSTWFPNFNTPEAFCNPILATRVRLK